MRRFVPIMLLIGLLALPAIGGERGREPEKRKWFRRTGTPTGLLPADQAIPGLAMIGKPRSWSASKAETYLDPEQLRVYTGFGFTDLMAAEYTYGPQGARLTVEAVVMHDPLGAAGAFHWVRLSKLNGEADFLQGIEPAEGVVDRRRGGWNAYFFKGHTLFKIIWNGPRPAPDLTDLARVVAGNVVESGRPMLAFTWMDVPGVDPATKAVTLGNTLNCPDLPRAAYARAPAAGTKATVYVIECGSRDKAEGVAKAYQGFLRLNGADQGSTTTDKGRRRVWWATDRRTTPVIATQKANAVLLVAHADSRRVGGALLDEIAARIER